MEYTYIGEIVNTHGIKGEIKIISDFKYKEYIFKPNTKIYIGKIKEEKTIKTYRHHKIFDMITIEGINDINDVLIYKGESVYIIKDTYEFPGYLNEDIIGINVYTDKLKGIVTEVINSKAHEILVVIDNDKKYYIPYIDSFIEKIDLDKKEIFIKDIKGLFE